MSQRIAVVGGSGGLGSAICSRLAADGADLVIGYRSNRDAAEGLAGDLSGHAGKVVAIAVDVRDPGSVDAFLAEADKALGGLTGLVNAVGPPIPLRPLVEVSAEEFREIMDTDVSGAFNLLTASSRLFAERGSGAIVQLLTAAVLRTLENDGMSGIPKTAIMGIVRQLAREVSQQHVRINAIAPGVIDAGIVHSSFTLDDTAKGVIELCLDRTPTPRMGEPGEVSGLVAFLLGDSAAYISGQIIGVDGGYSA